MLPTYFLIAAISMSQAAVDLAQPIFGAGYIVMLREAPKPGAPPVFVFSIQRAGLPEDSRAFRIAGLASIQQLRIYPGPFVAVLGITATGRMEAQLVDGLRGRTVFQQECASIEYHMERRSFLCSVGNEVRWVYPVATGRTERAYGAVPGLLKILSSGSLDARRRALPSIATTRALLESDDVRKALAEELQRAVSQDQADAARLASPNRLRIASDEREYLGELIETVARLGMVETLPSLVTADHFSSTLALTMFGSASVPWILGALEGPSSPGYSAQYRAELVYALSCALWKG